MPDTRTRPRRASAAALAIAMLTSLVAPSIVMSVGQAPGAVCVGGWATTNPPALGGATAVDITFVAGTPWIAGSENQEGAKPGGFTSVGETDGWRSVALAPTAGSSVLTAIAAAGTSQLWAAGETVGAMTQPLVQYWDGRRWIQHSVPRMRNGGALTDIGSLSSISAVAVGYSTDLSGPHPLALLWRSGKWAASPVPLNNFGSLSAVATGIDGKAWAVGWVETDTGFRPLLERWTGTAWRRETISGTGPAVLTGIVMQSRTEAWAVGYKQKTTGLSPLVLHWIGGSWRIEPSPPVSVRGGSILRDVTVVGDQVVAVGLAWDNSSRDSVPLIATLQGGTWNVTLSAGGVTAGDLIAVAAGPQLVAVGRTGGRSVAVTPCEPGHDPVPGDAAEAGWLGARPRNPSGSGANDEEDGSRAPRSIRGGAVTPAATLPPTVDVPGLEIRDLTAEAGLTKTTVTYSGAATDLDGDGWTDLVIGRHARPLLVLRNVDGAFQQPFTGGYEQVDRHGCSVGDIDLDGLPEIVCAVGANHGLGIKSNEVWLDPLDPAGTNRAAALGVDDPLGRGRRTVLFDANHDGRLDLYVANQPSRADGLPSTNRLYLNKNGQGFLASRKAGLDLSIGANCLVPADLNGDGWTDLIVCVAIPMANYVGLRVFRNDRGKFTDATAAMGLTSQGDLDVRVADLDGDGARDLIRVSATGLEVDLQRNGTFVPTYTLPATYAQSIALPDVNNDGRRDIYVVRGARNVTIQDLLLLNDGTGAGYTSVNLPSVQPGVGGSGVVLDYDHNGVDDLVVLHGNSAQDGPVQLLAFGPPWPGETPPPSPSPSPSPSAGPTPSPVPTPGPGTPAPETPATGTPTPDAGATPSPEATGIAAVPPNGSQGRPPAVGTFGGAVTLGILGLAALLLFGFQARRRSFPG